MSFYRQEFQLNASPFHIGAFYLYLHGLAEADYPAAFAAYHAVIVSIVFVIVVIQVGETAALVDGETRTLDVPAQIIQNRTMVPARFISEALGCSVTWDGTSQTAAVANRLNGEHIYIIEPLTNVKMCMVLNSNIGNVPTGGHIPGWNLAMEQLFYKGGAE